MLNLNNKFNKFNIYVELVNPDIRPSMGGNSFVWREWLRDNSIYDKVVKTKICDA